MVQLTAGQTLSSFEILGPLGAGAMGEVWRARDTRLQREVAIKVLPEHFAADAERLKRFEREARTLAALNHPNVAQIFGVDQVGDTCFLVLELVPGESLADRLARGALPVAEALDVARQIADGLEAAHEAGVIHRDLKPANVRITPDGKAKVLDFGLAKPVREDAGPSTDSVLSTEAGRLLGTPTYMAPEQARGKPIDRRVDVWAFGCVLYECLTGTRAFAGETLTDVFGAVLHQQPDLQALPAGTPAAVQQLIARCLEKDPRQRLRDVGEARTTLERVRVGTLDGRGAAAASAGSGTAARPNAFWNRPATIAVAFVAMLAVGAVAAWVAIDAHTEPISARVVRTDLVLPVDVAFADSDGTLALSPDGRTLVYVGQRLHEPFMLWSRPLDSAVPQPLAGTSNALYPFWSPDGRSIAFFADGKLKRIPARGGSVTTICDAPEGRGGTWSAQDVILFAPAPFGGLFRVPAAGGVPVAVTQADGQGSHRVPHFLPGGRRALYTETLDEAPSIQLLDLATGTSTHLLDVGSEGLYSPPGWLVFVRDSVLMAQPFDERAGRLTGEARRLTEPVVFDPQRCAGVYTPSAEGTLMYHSAFTRESIQLFDLDGHSLGPLGEGDLAPIDSVFVSPDGLHLAQARRRDDGRLDLWLVDTQRGLGQRLAGEIATPFALWSPDSRSVAYAASTADGMRTVVQALDGSPARPLPGVGNPAAWSPDGRTIALVHQDPISNIDVLLVAADGSGEPTPWMATPADEYATAFSPDGRWLLVTVSQPGGATFMAKAVGESSAGSSVTIDSEAVFGAWWLDDGRIVYLAGPAFRMMEVATRTRDDGGLEVGVPRELGLGRNRSIKWLTVTRDGKTAYAVQTKGAGESPVLTVVQDWRATLGDT